MSDRPVPAVAFVAHSGTGKTTLVERLIGELKGRGHRVGAIKHDAHDFEIDRPGKDSARFTAAGAEVMVLASDAKIATVRQTPAPVGVDALLAACCADLDIVLVEGYKTSDLPRIEVHRSELAGDLLHGSGAADPRLLAVASNGAPAVGVPVLDVDDPAAVADFLEEVVLGR